MISGAETLDLACSIRLRNSTAPAIQARIRHCNRGFLRIESPQWVLAESRVEVLFDKQSISGQVAYCTQNGRWYAIGVGYGHSEYVRSEPRIPVDLAARLSSPGIRPQMDIRIVDISAAGLGLLCPRSVTPGTQVTVDVPDGEIGGEACFCVPAGDSYRVGFNMERFTATGTRRLNPNFARRDQVGEKLLSSALLKFRNKLLEMELARYHQ